MSANRALHPITIHVEMPGASPIALFVQGTAEYAEATRVWLSERLSTNLWRPAMIEEMRKAVAAYDQEKSE